MSLYRIFWRADGFGVIMAIASPVRAVIDQHFAFVSGSHTMYLDWWRSRITKEARRLSPFLPPLARRVA